MDSSACCPVCGKLNSHLLIEQRSKVPTLQNTTLDTVDGAIAYPTGQLKMLRCSQCTFVWNDAFDISRITYDASYNNDVSTSNYYVEHVNAMADRVLATFPDDMPIHYVEIGCGEGDFLRLVLERSNGRCESAIGFDPSFTGEAKLPQGARVHKTFFGQEQISLVPPEANVICSRHTIEHVADARSFAAGLASLISKEGRRLLIETPDADWILKNVAFQDLFYEHCSIYTPTSISQLLADQGLSSRVVPVYGGQYIWAEAWLADADCLPASSALLNPLSQDSVGLPSDVVAEEYVVKRVEMVRHWMQYLLRRSEFGPVAVWGAASKGVTFALICNDDSVARVDFAIDLNKDKQGRFLPTTGIPVISPEEAQQNGVRTVVIMNPNYEIEIKELARSLEWDVEFSTLNEQS